MKTILASGSPRRAKILADLGIDFSVVKTGAPETAYPDDPARTVAENASAKEKAAREKIAQECSGPVTVIAADTIVWMDGKIYGKPKDMDEARQFLRELSGRTHKVFTGVSVNGETNVAVSDVTFRELSDDTIDSYVRLVRPLDRAGAYDIDEYGDMLIERWTGSYENIMGLPKELVANVK